MFAEYRRRGWRWHEGEEVEEEDVEDDEEASEQFDLIELLDSDVELRHWVASAGQVEGVSGFVERDEV